MSTRHFLAVVLASMATFGASANAGVLPNGWTVTPAGTLTPLGTLPLHMALDPSGKWIAVTNSGYAVEGVTIVNAATGAVAASKALPGTFYGIAFSPDGKSLYASTAAKSGVERFAFDPATGSLRDLGAWTVSTKNVWIAGIAVSPDGKTVYAAGNLSDTLYAIDASTGATSWTARTGNGPYAVVASPDGARVYVSDWTGDAVSVISSHDGSVVKTIPVGAHPNAMVLTRDGKTLYVACANSATVAQIDTTALAPVRTLSPALWSSAPEGTTPNGLALSSDEGTLFVADADDDAVVAVDLASGLVSGAVPAGWYATDVAVGGRTLFVLDGKGVSSHPNPKYQHGDVDKFEDDTWYDGTLATGDLERVDVPDPVSLKLGLNAAVADAAYKGTTRWPIADGDVYSANARTPVKHVIYVIKENRTYDEVLGDDPRGNGMASLAIFGKRITPNIHRLADDFALLDDFDVDSTVSADGHNWADSAFATDYVQKLWPSNYSGRGRDYEFEGDPRSDPPGGYLWDDAVAHHVSFRDYGEYIAPAGHAESSGLAGRFDPKYIGWDLKVSDQTRMDEWTREFDAFVKDGDLPRLEMVYLPDDHTSGVAPGARTPYAYLASNDLAVGRLVDAVSHSRYWTDTVIFVVEDDAQAGPDHVDDQRAEALVAGGLVKRGIVDHTHYTQCSVLATIEEILGMAPMSQFDAGATTMFGLFSSRPDATPWSASKPYVDLSATNPKAPKGSQTSMDFSAPDRVDAATMDRILMEYARGQRP